MKILYVSGYYKPLWEAGGPANVAYNLAEYMAKKGHDITVYTTNYYIKEHDLVLNKKIKVDNCNVIYFENLRRFLPNYKTFPNLPLRMLFVARKNLRNYDLIHIHAYRTLFTLIIVYYANRYHIPYILEPHGSVPPGLSRGRWWDKLVGKKILHSASKLFALQDIERNHLLQMNADDEKIVCIPNGVNLGEYSVLPDSGYIREKYSIPKKAKLLLYLARVDPKKGVDLLIDAVDLFIRDNPDVYVLIVGPDVNGYLLKMKQKVDLLGLNKQILFSGPLYEKEKISAYVDADIYILPSYSDCFPVSVMEACACGTPVVVTTGCQISKIILEEHVGVVTKLDASELKDGILSLLFDDERLMEYSHNARNMILKEYNTDCIYSQIEDAYLHILNK